MLLGPTPGVGAGEPTEQLRSDIDELYRSVNAPAAAPGQGGAPPRATVDRMFDWSAMAEPSRRGYWPDRTPGDRAEFTRLFPHLFARAHLSRINLAAASTFQSLGSITVGEP